DRYQGFNDFGTALNFRGASFPFTPKWQLSSTANYRFDISDHLDGRFSVTGRYTSSQRGDLEGNSLFKIDKYALVDANFVVRTSDDAWEFEVYVKNITNKYYWNSVQLNQDSLVRYAGMPRTWGVSVQAKF
ncbi:MAG: hypothetical protein B7Z20_00455, partial [Sphingobium sp. 32-64-5]